MARGLSLKLRRWLDPHRGPVTKIMAANDRPVRVKGEEGEFRRIGEAMPHSVDDKPVLPIAYISAAFSPGAVPADNAITKAAKQDRIGRVHISGPVLCRLPDNGFPR